MFSCILNYFKLCFQFKVKLILQKMSIKPVLLDYIIGNIQSVQSDEQTYFSALDKLSSNQSTFYSVHLLLTNIEVFNINDKGQKVFEYEFPNEGDIISYIDCSSDYKIMINSKLYEGTNRIVLCATNYSQNKLQITIKDNTEKIYIFYRVTVLNTKLREKIIFTPLLSCDDILYSEGMTL